MKTNKSILFLIIGLLLIGLVTIIVIFGQKKSKTTTNNTVNKTVSTKSIEFKEEEKPYISLIPRTDGHELKLKIENIPSTVNQIDYELIYIAVDKTTQLEMEKGVGDTVKEITKNMEKDILLGTASCTNGCKYAYDEGVTGGTLTLIFNTNEGQVTFNTPFSLVSSADIKTRGLTLPTENITINATTTTKSDFFILLKNLKSVYSVFSNSTGAGKITSIDPSSVTKQNTDSLIGDYLIQ
jgi:hypothetical protein